MIGIYKITNLINQKTYIGQSINIEQRWREHKNHAFCIGHQTYQRPLYCAMRKYGLDNFNFEVIELCDKSQLNEREQYWILFYHSLINENGYNLILSNQTANHQNQIVKQYDLKGNYIATFNSFREAERATGIDHTLISRCCSINYKNCHAGPYQWCLNDNDLTGHKCTTHTVQVAQYNINNELICTYNSIKEAATAMHVRPQTLSSAIKHGYKTGGFIWKRI